MDALAETWYLSGKRSDDLYIGKIEEIVKELKEWIKARLVRNQAIIVLLWEFFKTNDIIFHLSQRYGSLQDVRIAPFKAKYVKNRERIKEAKEDRYRQYVRALYLIATLSHRGFDWPGIPCRSQWSEIDSEVCAFLGSQDRKFAAGKQLEILEMEEAFEKWHLENARRVAEEASETAESHTEDYDMTPDVRSAASNVRDQFPGPVDIKDLTPPPRSEVIESPTDALSNISEGSGEEGDSESEELPQETPEAIAERINRVDTIDQKPKTAKKSKTKSRNAQRRKAKARAKEAVKNPSLTGDDEHGLQKSTIDD